MLLDENGKEMPFEVEIHHRLAAQTFPAQSALPFRFSGEATNGPVEMFSTKISLLPSVLAWKREADAF